MIFFGNYKLQKAELVKCPKSPVSEHLWTVNILKGPKDCLNLHSGVFPIFPDHSERKSAEKFIFSSIWNLETVCQNIDTRRQIFSLNKSECLTQRIQVQLSPNQNIFFQFFLHFRKLHKIWNTLKQKMSLRGYFFWNYRLQKAALLKCLKSPLSEHLWTVHMLKGPKNCLNLHGSIFVIFFDHSERKLAQKILFQ